MSALEYRTILKYRLMIPLFPVDEPCPVCRKVCLDSFGEHAVHCKELPGFKYRHDLVRDVLYDVLKRAEFLLERAPVKLSTIHAREGQAALKAESSKVAKHEKACLENTTTDVGKSILESYSLLESLAYNIVARVDDLLYVDDLSKQSELNTENLGLIGDSPSSNFAGDSLILWSFYIAVYLSYCPAYVARCLEIRLLWNLGPSGFFVCLVPGYWFSMLSLYAFHYVPKMWWVAFAVGMFVRATAGVGVECPCLRRTVFQVVTRCG
ncbi:putative reverse transcriptase domain-containing protein [Tanacetum coccineum]